MKTNKIDNNWLSFDAFEVAEAIRNFNTVKLASMAREASDIIYNWLCNSTNNLPAADKDFHKYLRKLLILQHFFLPNLLTKSFGNAKPS